MIGLADVIQSHLTDFKKDLYTSLPAVVEEVTNTNPLTITASPLLAERRPDSGTQIPPKIYGVPVLQMASGGASITLPVNVGDTVMLMFSMRNIANWLDGDGEGKTSITFDSHKLTDAVAITGLFADESPNKVDAPQDRIKINYGDSTIELQEDQININSSSKIILGEEAIDPLLERGVANGDKTNAALSAIQTALFADVAVLTSLGLVNLAALAIDPLFIADIAAVENEKIKVE